MSARIRFALVATACFGLSCVAAAQSEQPRRPDQPARTAQQSRQAELRVGQLAPTFVLSPLKGEGTFDLKEFRGKKPVILFFGSYT